MRLKDAHAGLKRAVADTTSLMKNGQGSVVEDVITRVVVDCLKKYQAKVNAGAEDVVARLLDTFKAKVASEIFDVAQGWVVSTKQERTLFPQNCRYLYSIGRSTIVVVEEGPAVRTLTLDESLLGAGTPADLAGGNVGRTRRQSLAMPFVVFMLHIEGDRLSGLYVGWRKAPLRTLDDEIGQTVMPNTYTNMSVCMGGMAYTGDVVAITSEVIGDYWTGVFGNELAVNWWGRGQLDPRLKTWPEESAADPLFMLEIDYRRAGTLRGLIDTTVSSQGHEPPDASNLRHRLSETIDVCSDRMFEKMMSYYRSTRFDRFYPKDAVEVLSESIKNISHEILGILMAMNIDLDNLSNEVYKSQKDQAHYGWVPSGPFWVE